MCARISISGWFVSALASSNDEISPLLNDCSEIFSFGITTIGDVDFSRLNGTMGQTFGSMLIRDSNVSKRTAC